MTDVNKEESRLDNDNNSNLNDCYTETTKNENDILNEKWEKFTNWIHCICVVAFDLELGQVIESVYPQHVNLSKQEATSICYLAFPDSNSGCMGDTYFTVRLKQGPGNVALSKTHASYNEKCYAALQIEPGYFWGYVYFRQVKDPTLPRGYFQKSVVILSRLPFCNLFQKLSLLIAPEFFAEGSLSIEAACHNINCWTPPIPGQFVNLPILGREIRVSIPAQNRPGIVSNSQTETASSSSESPLLQLSLTDNNLFKVILPVLSHIYTLWELVLVAEPLIVMASSPTHCSSLVVALTSIISPFKYCSDHRPYFTIHDNDFKEFTGSVIKNPLVILGVTNPFFSKTLHHWPHTIRLGEDPMTVLKYKLKKSSSNKVLDASPGFFTNYKPFLQKDKNFIKKLLAAIHSNRPLEAQTALLKRNLLELTQSFMIPLESYMASLMPLQKNISPFKAAPTPLPFKQDDFLAKLEASGPQLTSGIKGDWEGLYRRFFRSPNFFGWFNMRDKELVLKLQALQLQALADADIKSWVVDKPEVELVDMVLKIKAKINKCKEYDLPVTKETKHRLRLRLEEILCTLPEDLKNILEINY